MKHNVNMKALITDVMKYNRSDSWVAHWRMLGRILSGICYFACHPRIGLRWWKMFWPYAMRWLVTLEQPAYLVRHWFDIAWLRAHRTGRQPGTPLPVLTNAIDAPCDGCGGKCCSIPPGGVGFTVVLVYPWEEYITRHRRECEPDPNRPGEWRFHMTRSPDDSYRCRHLSSDGRCEVHAYRPMACRAFNCADGLIKDDIRCSGEFVSKVPAVHERLIQLGFKRIDWDYAVRAKGYASQYPSGDPYFDATTGLAECVKIEVRKNRKLPVRLPVLQPPVKRDKESMLSSITEGKTAI